MIINYYCLFFLWWRRQVTLSRLSGATPIVLLLNYIPEILKLYGTTILLKNQFFIYILINNLKRTDNNILIINNTNT